METLKNNLILISLFVFSALLVLPLLQPGFFNIHDDTQVQRVFEMKTALTDGTFPVRWVPNLGYGHGYPIFNFYAPLAYYIGAFFMFFGLNALSATKLMIGIGAMSAGISMYFLGKEFWGKLGGLLSALLYLYAPYHALDIYVRGDIGEIYAYAFIPSIFYGLWKYYKTQKFLYLAIGSVSYAGVIASHNLTALMISPFILFVSLVLLSKTRSLQILFIPVVGVLLASFYWLPALLEMNYTNVLSTIGGKADFRDHFVCLRQLWDSPWMFGGSAPGCTDGLSFRLGKLHVLLASIAVLVFLAIFKKEKEKSLAIGISIALLLFSIFLMLDASKFIWEKTPYMNFFQYPWRFLLASSFFASFIGGSIIYFLSRFESKKNKLLMIGIYLVLIILPIALYLKLFVPQSYLLKISDDYTSQRSLKWTTSKISDEYLPRSFKAPEAEEEIIGDKISGENINVTDQALKTNKLSAMIESPEDTRITIHTPYFPAWKYYINGKKVDVVEEDNGVSLSMPKGSNIVTARFEETPVEKTGNLLSLSGVLGLLVGIIYAKQKGSLR
ncbi:MAG: hypothetical protein HYW63_01850 [Candidatus Levybacteria bacterium]|nr:hypothetical protein [Candidatus Levybacteria bacterium]